MSHEAPLTIGFVLDDGLDKPDGVQQHILTLGEWFVSRGHKVHYLVGETERTDIANIHVMSRNLKVRFNGNVLSSPFPAKTSRIRQVLSDNKFDVLHIQIPYSPFMAARILRRADTRTAAIGTFHILPVGWTQHSLTWFLGLWLQHSLRRFDKFFSVSSPAADFARKTFHINSSVLPNPVNITRFEPAQLAKNTGNTVQIVFLGRLVGRKGCYQLLEALNHLVRGNLISKNPEIHICGSGPLRRKLEQYTKQNHLSEMIYFHGFVSEEEKITHLQQADIAVFPSLGGESFGIVLIEAMAAKAGVVLGGNNPGYNSVLSSMPESLFDPENINEFALILQKYIENPDKRRALHIKQQQLVVGYDVQKTGSKLLETYTDCINQRKSR